MSYSKKAKLLLLCLIFGTGLLILWTLHFLHVKNELSNVDNFSDLSVRNEVDIHQETDNSDDNDDRLVLHTHKRANVNVKDARIPVVAMGLAVTSAGIADITEANMMFRFSFFKTLLPSFCKTISEQYKYDFYLAFDSTDTFFGDRQFISSFTTNFRKRLEESCTSSLSHAISLHFIECSHAGSPARAQNDAMIEAYLDGCDYFYRINDDIQFLSPGWTEEFIMTLRGFSPPFVGVVGPMHSGGNEKILTFDFVHRTHINVFGFYYPRLFTDWWADDWMTTVYQPEWSIKVASVKVRHTMETGTRYEVDVNRGQLWEKRVEQDRATLLRYVTASRAGLLDSRNSSRIISYSLWGNKAKYTHGIIRNLQLAPIYFPFWTVRVYIEDSDQEGGTIYPPVPTRILQTMMDLGAQIFKVDVRSNPIPPMMWRFLIADDEDVDVFIVRDGDSRLNDRDAAAVDAWLRSDTAFHCIRDHPSHAIYVVSGGLWGARRASLHSLIKLPWRHLTTGMTSGYGQDLHFLTNVIWPRVKSAALCHDSVSCGQWPHAVAVPTMRHGLQHIGQVFDEFEVPRQEDLDILMNFHPPPECATVNAADDDGAEQIARDVLNFNPALPNRSSTTTAAKPTISASVLAVYTDKRQALDLQATFRQLDILLAVLHCSEMSLCAGDMVNEHIVTMKINDAITSFVKVVICFIPGVLCDKLSHSSNRTFYSVVVVTDRFNKVSDTVAGSSNDSALPCNSSLGQVVSSNLYDGHYLLHRIGCASTVLWPLCGPSAERTLEKSSSALLNVLVHSTTRTSFAELFYRTLKARIESLRNSAVLIHFSADISSSAYASTVRELNAIVYIPSQVSTLDMSEHYRANIPLFLPSLDSLLAWNAEHHMLSDMRSIDTELLLHPTLNRSRHRTDGDPLYDESEVNQRRWLSYADFSQWPHIQYFAGIEDLIDKIFAANLTLISRQMSLENRRTQSICTQFWKQVVSLHL